MLYNSFLLLIYFIYSSVCKYQSQSPNLSLLGHDTVSVEQDMGRDAKRLRAWRVPPALGCEVAHHATTPGCPRPPVTCLGGQQGRAREGWMLGWW